MQRIGIVRKNGGWNSVPSGGGGTAFLISWDRLESMLQGDGGVGKLREGEIVDRFEVGDDGVTVYIGKAE